jgi:NTP pyrophosphatase (non-canonical NTP hydrolase)
MNAEEMSEILADAVDIYGTEAQIWMMMEEMSELGNAIAKYQRGRVTEEDVCEEIADVIIMCFQMAAIFGSEEVNEILDAKMERLKKRLEKHHVTNSKTDVAGEV